MSDVWQSIEREPQPRICGSDLPGCGPLVSFETSVGKTLEPGGVIDADIEAIYETAAAVGLNEREMDGVEIVFASRKHSEILPSGCSGYYQYQNGRHCIKIRCDKDAAKTARGGLCRAVHNELVRKQGAPCRQVARHLRLPGELQALLGATGAVDRKSVV